MSGKLNTLALDPHIIHLGFRSCVHFSMAFHIYVKVSLWEIYNSPVKISNTKFFFWSKNVWSIHIFIYIWNKTIIPCFVFLIMLTPIYFYHFQWRYNHIFIEIKLTIEFNNNLYITRNITHTSPIWYLLVGKYFIVFIS